MIAIGSRVSWMADSTQSTGTVIEVFFDSVTRTLDEIEVTCLGSRENPAYLITADDGTHILRLKSEVRPETDILKAHSLEGEPEGSE
jgi:hypothetical protein